MGAGRNEYDYLYVCSLVDVQVLAVERLLEAWGKPAPEEGKKVDRENFNATNNERMVFWEFNRKVAAAAAGQPVALKDIVVIPTILGLLIGWVSE